MTAVKYSDEILCPVAVPLVQQRQLILQQETARPHVADMSLSGFSIKKQ